MSLCHDNTVDLFNTVIMTRYQWIDGFFMMWVVYGYGFFMDMDFLWIGDSRRL